MAKKPLKGSKKASHRTSSGRSKSNGWRNGAIMVGLVLVGLLLACYRVFPDELHWFLQKLLGLVLGALAGGTAWMATHPAPQEDLMERMHRGQHLDFGKEIRSQRKKERTVDLPFLGTVKLRNLASVGIALVMFGWWLSPLGPIDVRARQVEDLAGSLGQEVSGLMLTMADECLATPCPPRIAQRARELAPLLGDKATPYQLATKAIAEGRHDQATRLLDALKPNEEENLSAAKIQAVRGLNALLAHRFADAAEAYRLACLAEPENTAWLCQSAAASVHAGDFEAASVAAKRAIELSELSEEDAAETLSVATLLQASIAILRQQDLDEAKDLVELAKIRLEAALDENHPWQALCDNNQAVLSGLQGRYAAADNLTSLAHSQWAKSLPSDHPYLPAGEISLVVIRCLKAQYADALRIDRELRPKATDDQPHFDAMELPWNRHATWMVELWTGTFDDAISEVERDEPALAELLGPKHPQRIAVLATLADVHESKALHRKAEIDLRRAMELADAVLGPDHPYQAVLKCRVASILLAEDRNQSARAVLDEASPFVELLPPDHPLEARHLLLIGQLEMLEEGNRTLARKALDRAESILKRTFPDGHPDLARAIALRAMLTSKSATNSLAAEGILAAIRMQKQTLPEDHPAIAELQVMLTRMYLEHREFDKAKAALIPAIEIRRNRLESYHPLLAETMELYAEILLGIDPTKNAQEVKEYARRADDIRARHAERDRTR